MYFDALTVLAVRDELRAAVLGGRIQHVHLPDDQSLALEVYAEGARRWLYANWQPQQGRLHLVGERPARASDRVTPLLLLLRKYADGARIDSIEQPPLERILEIGLATRLTDGRPAHTRLVVEVLGRQCNVILVDEDGTILDAARRVGGAESRTRTILPRWRYAPPPAPAKLDPRTLSPAGLARAAAAVPDQSLPNLLVSAVNACSPLLAREVVWRAHGRAAEAIDQPDWDRVAAAMRAIWEDAAAGRAAPSVAVEDSEGNADSADDADARLAAYAPYLLRCYPHVRPIGSISAAVRSWCAQSGRAIGTGDPEAARKRALRQALEAAQDRLRAKRFSLQRSLPAPDEVDRARLAGEALLAFAAQVEPGAAVFRAPGEGRVIDLDPQLSAVENAQRYFARYAKTRDAAREVPAMLASVENDLRYLDDALVQLDLAHSPAELSALQAEWAELGFTKPPKVPGRQKRGLGLSPKRGHARRAREDSLGQVARMEVGGYDVLIGRSGRGNDALLGPDSHPDDVWLHVRGVPGAHVLVRTRGRQPPEAVVRRAAALAAAHSQARGAGSVPVDCTVRKYVQRIKGAPPGVVTYRGERTLYVTPEA